MSSTYYTLQLVGYSLFNVNLCGVPKKYVNSIFIQLSYFIKSGLFVGNIL